MSKFIYIQSENGPVHDLYTVGHYDPNGKFQPESDHNDPEEAAKRTRYLNGGSMNEYTPKEIIEALQSLWAGLDLYDFFEMWDIDNPEDWNEDSQDMKLWQKWQDKPLAFIGSRDIAEVNRIVRAVKEKADQIKSIRG